MSLSQTEHTLMTSGNGSINLPNFFLSKRLLYFLFGVLLDASKVPRHVGHAICLWTIFTTNPAMYVMTFFCTLRYNTWIVDGYYIIIIFFRGINQMFVSRL